MQKWIKILVPLGMIFYWFFIDFWSQDNIADSTIWLWKHMVFEWFYLFDSLENVNHKYNKINQKMSPKSTKNLSKNGPKLDKNADGFWDWFSDRFGVDFWSILGSILGSKSFQNRPKMAPGRMVQQMMEKWGGRSMRELGWGVPINNTIHPSRGP